MRSKRLKKKKLRKKRFKIILISILLVICGIASGCLTYYYNETKSWNNLIYPMVNIENTNISGKTKEQAKKTLENKYNKLLDNTKIKVNVNGKLYTLKYSDIQPKYNINETIKIAFNYGKNLNLLKKYNLIKKPKSINYNLKFTYNKKTIDDFVKNIQKNTNSNPKNATLSVPNGNFVVTPGQNGIKLESDKLKQNLISKINGKLSKDLEIEGHTKEISPKITSDKLKTINSSISSYTTNFSSSTAQRSNNIILATKSINGKILMPGDIFSFNNVVGPRTIEKGYQSAPIIIKDRLEPGIGGGICQVSSTLYNAVFNTKATTIELTHHTLPVSYVPKGRDATIDYGNIDYKFKNATSYPMYIEGYTSNGNLTFNVYSHR